MRFLTLLLFPILCEGFFIKTSLQITTPEAPVLFTDLPTEGLAGLRDFHDGAEGAFDEEPKNDDEDWHFTLEDLGLDLKKLKFPAPSLNMADIFLFSILTLIIYVPLISFHCLFITCTMSAKIRRLRKSIQKLEMSFAKVKNEEVQGGHHEDLEDGSNFVTL